MCLKLSYFAQEKYKGESNEFIVNMRHRSAAFFDTISISFYFMVKSFTWLTFVILTNKILSPQGVSERKLWARQKSIIEEECITISTLQNSVY